MTPTWVIGAGGLLGSAIARASKRPFRVVVPWSDPEAAEAAIARGAREFAHLAGTGPWQVAWAGGAATTASTEAETDAELGTFRRCLAALSGLMPAGPGAFLLASSAGGAYAGAERPPFDERTTPVPLGPYGRLKLAQEALATQALGQRCPVLLARFANLYGPGQDLRKLQGIVSRLALSLVTREPVNVFVPLDTLRDYLEVDDAAAMALWWLERARVEGRGGTVVIASGRPMPLGEVIGTVGTVAGRRVPVAFGTHASAAAQARDLRLLPTRAAEVAHLQRTTFAEGVRRTCDDVRLRHQLAAAPA